MKVVILNADLIGNDKDGYLGHVRFEVEGHKQPYELTLQSDHRMVDWNYALSFLNESGSEEEYAAVDNAIAENDDLFDSFIESVMNHKTDK